MKNFGKNTMVPFDKALDTVLDSARPVGTEKVSLNECVNRVLAEDVSSDLDMPPFNKAAMDGYACRRKDLSENLHVVESIRAGQVPRRKIGQGECAKIMTGAMVPLGADCVIMVESTIETSDTTVRFTDTTTADNICIKAEDIKTGDIVLKRGTLIGPSEIAVMATVGATFPEVSCPVKVGIITTGDEIIEPEGKPLPAQIRNSNGLQLCAQTKRVGAEPSYYGIVPDQADALQNTLDTALSQEDVVLLSGGVSMGDFDLVPEAMKACGIELVFEQVATKPGRPTVFGISDQALCIGLAGNPVATFVVFEVIVKPLLYSMMRYIWKPPWIRMPLAENIKVKPTERKVWIPVAITEKGLVKRINLHGSAHSNALCLADGLVSIPPRVSQVRRGSKIQVQLI